MPGGFYTGGGATVIMNPPPVVYVQVFHPSSGPDRHLRRKAQRVAIVAAEKAPFKSGALSRSIRVDQNRDELGRYAFGFKVYTNIRYGGYVHEGTGPSIRYGLEKRMKFPGTNQYAGQTVYPSIVFHPGISGQPFLQQALIAMAG